MSRKMDSKPVWKTKDYQEEKLPSLLTEITMLLEIIQLLVKAQNNTSDVFVQIIKVKRT